jgi:superfamily II DNA or RNA helicase
MDAPPPAQCHTSIVQSFDPASFSSQGANVLSDAFAGLQKLMLPDRWQALALTALRAGKDVIVDAPTGAGKTYIFERWAEQTNFSRRALFAVHRAHARAGQ